MTLSPGQMRNRQTICKQYEELNQKPWKLFKQSCFGYHAQSLFTSLPQTMQLRYCMITKIQLKVKIHLDKLKKKK